VPRLVIALSGPLASGKSELAEGLQRHFAVLLFSTREHLRARGAQGGRADQRTLGDELDKAGGRWVDVKSADINAYLKEATGGDFSAKDFRTWSGTVLAAVALAVAGIAAGSKTSRKRAKTRAVKEVSRYLGNTPAVCRASYIDPRVFDRFDGGLTIGGALPELVEDTAAWPHVQRAVEEAVLELIADNRESDLVENGVELAAVA